MARAHLMKALERRVNGQPLTGATIRVLQPGTTTPITAPLYAGPSSGTTLSNPFVAALPYVDFYLDTPQRVRIGVTPPDGPEVFFEDVDVDRPTESADVTPYVPAPTRYCMSTVGAELPLFADRIAGDKHFNQTDLKDYVLTGAAAVNITDLFTRTGNLGGSTTTTGGRTWTVTNNGSTFNNGWTVNGSRAVHNLAVGSPFAQIDMLSGDIDFTVSFTKGSSDGIVGTHQTADNFTTGYYISLRENFTEVYNGATYLGTFGGGNPLGSTKTIRIVRSGGIVYYYANGTLLTSATAAAATGTRITIVDNTGSGTPAEFDNVSAFSAGTLAWTSTDEYVAPHTHALPTRSTTAAISTVGAGLPTFSGRVAGDLHYDSTAHREFVLTGAAGASARDTFTRANQAGLGTTETGNKTWTVDNNSLVQVNTNRLYFFSGSGGRSASIVGNGAASGRMSVKVVQVDGGNTVYPKIRSAGGFGDGYSWAVAGGSNAEVRRAGNNPSGGSGSTTTSWAANDIFEVEVVNTGSSATVYWRKNGTTIYTLSDASPLTGNNVGIDAGSNAGAQVDDFEYDDLGSLAWQQVEPVCLQTIAAGTASVTANAVKPGLRVPHATTARDLVVRLDTAPTGASYIVTFERWNNGSFANNIGTVTVAAGSTVASTTGLSVGLAKGDVIKFNVTQVGSTIAGADVQFNVDCW